MCGIKLKYFLSVLFLLLAASLFSLSQEEKEILPTLDKVTLIEIIMTYDKGLSLLETSLSEKQKELDVSENNLKEIKALLRTQEELYRISYARQKNLLKCNTQLKVFLYIAGGIILGETVYIIGGLNR